jgi:site-specific DNA recombinase
MDRGLFDAAGHLVRRLQPGEYVRQAGHRVHLLPCKDQGKIDAVRFAFTRFDSADLGPRDIARELEAKGYPSPTGKGWTHHNVRGLLRMKAYAGTASWGVTSWGKYHTARGEDIVATNGNGKHRGRRLKPQEDAISVDGAHEGIIPVALFNRVQRKLPQQGEKPYVPKRKANYPLAGLIFCGHCGQPMYGNSLHAKDRQGDKQYEYSQYICRSYANGNGPTNATCGRNPIDAGRVLGWLVHKLQEVYLGPGRAALVQEIRKQLQAEPKANSGDMERLQKRAADLEREVSRLVKAIRTLDAAELVEELALVQAERDRVKAEIAQAGRLTDPMDLDAEAERIAEGLWEIGQHLNDPDPAVVREVLHQFVERITCRWKTSKGKSRTRSRLVGGKVELREQTPFSVCGVMAQAT